jgi:predicted metal-dependent hydrolase
MEHNEWPVEIVRSDRRRKSVSAELRQGVLLVRAPATISDTELQHIVDKLRSRLQNRYRPIPSGDEVLQKRAQELNKTYFYGKLRWQSIRYVTNQNKRFGSCTPAKGTIRISHRVAALPRFVQDYVLMHELAHLEEAHHGPHFWQLVSRYPLAERARGYLMAIGLEEMEGE